MAKAAHQQTVESLLGLPGRVRQIMNATGLRQADIVERSSWDSGNLSRLLGSDDPAENRVLGIQASSVIELARALNVRVGYLLTGEEPAVVDASVQAHLQLIADEVRRRIARDTLSALSLSDARGSPIRQLDPFTEDEPDADGEPESTPSERA